MSSPALDRGNDAPAVQLQDIWFAYRVPRPAASLRLFCLPHAGGGASLFRAWSESLGSLAEVLAIQLPGRETRLTEPAVPSLAALIPPLADAVASAIDRPYAIFGHSMGALIGFELVRELRRRGAAMPVQLFLASYCAPHLLHRDDRASTVKHEAARQVAGVAVPAGMKQELLAAFVPTLEADTRLCESYEFTAEDPLPCPIAAFRGLTDYVCDEHLAGWRAHTRGDFHAQTFLGDHFFVRDTPRGAIQAVHRALARRAAG